MESTCRVRVLALGSAAEACGWQAREISLPAGATLATLVGLLERDHPRIAQARGRLRFAVNRAYADVEAPLGEGDEVAIIPPVSGGALPAARLTREPIDVAALLREVESPNVGGIAAFVGVVRYETNGEGRGLHALQYTAYDAMALREMGRLCEQALAHHAVHKAVIVHRLGTLRIGDVSVAVVVSAPHRDEAFRSCRELIDQLKQTVPIFKKEIWQGGSSNWVDGV